MFVANAVAAPAYLMELSSDVLRLLSQMLFQLLLPTVHTADFDKDVVVHMGTCPFRA